MIYLFSHFCSITLTRAVRLVLGHVQPAAVTYCTARLSMLVTADPRLATATERSASRLPENSWFTDSSWRREYLSPDAAGTTALL
jgi:hypothetical protein